jgi:hypothetical protein
MVSRASAAESQSETREWAMWCMSHTCTIKIPPPFPYNNGRMRGSRCAHHRSTRCTYRGSYVRMRSRWPSACRIPRRYGGRPPKSHSPHAYGPGLRSTPPAIAYALTSPICPYPSHQGRLSLVQSTRKCARGHYLNRMYSPRLYAKRKNASTSLSPLKS